MPGAVIVSTVVNIVWSGLSARSKASRREMNGLKDDLRGQELRITTLGDRMTKIETKVSTMPTSEDIAELTQQLSQTNGELRQVIGEFSGVKHQMSLIASHLLERAKA